MTGEEQNEDSTGSFQTTSEQQQKVLMEEIKERSNLSKLTLQESVFSEFGSKSLILKALSGVSWVTCTLVGHKPDSAQTLGRQLDTAWDGSSGKRALFASKASLTELTAMDFDFSKSKLLNVVQRFPNLASLKLEGYGCADNLQHNKLEELDILGFWDPTYPRKPVRLQGAWLPSLRHLTARACCKTAPGSGKIFLLGSIADRNLLPQNLEVLKLRWHMTIGVGELVNGTLLQKLLLTSDCKHLQKVYLQVTEAAANESSVDLACTGELFRPEARRLFSTCSSLEELCFSGSNGDMMVKWERTLEGIRESDYYYYIGSQIID